MSTYHRFVAEIDANQGEVNPDDVKRLCSMVWGLDYAGVCAAWRIYNEDRPRRTLSKRRPVLDSHKLNGLRKNAILLPMKIKTFEEFSSLAGLEITPMIIEAKDDLMKMKVSHLI